MHWLWGTQIMATVIPDASGINEALIPYLNGLAQTEVPEIRSNRNGAWQSLNKAFLNASSHSASKVRKQVKRLRAHVTNAIHDFMHGNLKEGEGPKLKSSSSALDISIDASWANVNPPCSMNGPHVHPFAVVSGAYYLSCGTNSTTQSPCIISLVDPRPSAPMSHMPGKVRDALDWGIDWTLSLSPGTVLLFPSWLTHWVLPNSASETRITVSFNAGVKVSEPATQEL